MSHCVRNISCLMYLSGTWGSVTVIITTAALITAVFALALLGDKRCLWDNFFLIRRIKDDLLSRRLVLQTQSDQSEGINHNTHQQAVHSTFVQINCRALFAKVTAGETFPLARPHCDSETKSQFQIENCTSYTTSLIWQSMHGVLTTSDRAFLMRSFCDLASFTLSFTLVTLCAFDNLRLSNFCVNGDLSFFSFFLFSSDAAITGVTVVLLSEVFFTFFFFGLILSDKTRLALSFLFLTSMETDTFWAAVVGLLILPPSTSVLCSWDVLLASLKLGLVFADLYSWSILPDSMRSNKSSSSSSQWLEDCLRLSGEGWSSSSAVTYKLLSEQTVVHARLGVLTLWRNSEMMSSVSWELSDSSCLAIFDSFDFFFFICFGSIWSEEESLSESLS